MNTRELLNLVESLTHIEFSEKIQDSFHDLFEFCFNNHEKTFIFNSPEFVKKLSEIERKLSKYHSFLSPIQEREVIEIGAEKYFHPALIAKLNEHENLEKANPGSFTSYFEEYVQDRQKYVEYLSNLEESLSFFISENAKDTSINGELSLLIPKTLYEDSLDGLSKELNVINKVLRTFSEISNGSIEEIKVSRISTSDPVFVFSFGAETIMTVGAAITWGLHTWKSIEEIRKLRSDVEKIMGEKSEILEKFNRDMDAKIASKIDQKTSEIISSVNISKERLYELEKAVNWSLNTILARLERGLIAQIEFQPNSENNSDNSLDRRLKQIQNEMQYPIFEGRPVLNLPPMPGGQNSPPTTSPQQKSAN